MLIGRRNLTDWDVEVRVLDVICAGSWRDFHWMAIWGDHCPLELLKSKGSLSFLLYWSLKKLKSWLLPHSSLLYWHFENKNFSFYFGKFFSFWGKSSVDKEWLLRKEGGSARWCPHALNGRYVACKMVPQWNLRHKNTTCHVQMFSGQISPWTICPDSLSSQQNLKLIHA